MQIIPGLHQITSRNTNVFIIIERKITIIDTGFRGSSRTIDHALKKLGRSISEVSHIFITHNHLDHIGGLPELIRKTQAKTAVHKADLSFGEQGLPYGGFIKWLLKFPGISFFWPLIYATPDDFDILLEGGEVFDPLGGMEILHTPGHTPGSISLLLRHKKLIIIGDILNNGRGELHLTPQSVSSDMSQVRESVRRLAQINFEIMCFGHGRPIIGEASAMLKDFVKRKNL
ncbi:MAG: MBL fold metallo-hydrolase [Dehalococcoidia bacterium]|nr:MAG: MBL fold metallo-hydrolase [Dehalococcoidia bacterium]